MYKKSESLKVVLLSEKQFVQDVSDQIKSQEQCEIDIKGYKRAVLFSFMLKLKRTVLFLAKKFISQVYKHKTNDNQPKPVWKNKNANDRYPKY